MVTLRLQVEQEREDGQKARLTHGLYNRLSLPRPGLSPFLGPADLAQVEHLFIGGLRVVVPDVAGQENEGLGIGQVGQVGLRFGVVHQPRHLFLAAGPQWVVQEQLFPSLVPSVLP